MKKLFSILSLFILFIFSSCETEKLVLQKSDIVIKRFSMRDNFGKSKPKLNETIKKVKSLKTDNNQSINARLVYDANSGFYFDDEKGMYIEKDGQKTYTFPIINAQENEKIKNLCFKEKLNGNFDVFLVKYDFTKTEYNTLTEEQLRQRETEFEALVKDGVIERFAYVCVDVMEYVIDDVVPLDQGELTGNFGYQGGGGHWVTQATFCSFVNISDNLGGDGFNGGLGDGSSSGNDGSGTGGVVDNGLVTATVLDDTEAIIPGNASLNVLIDDFISDFTDNQKDIFNTNQSLRDYLILNGWFGPSRNFIREVVFSMDAVSSLSVLDAMNNVFVSSLTSQQQNVYNNNPQISAYLDTNIFSTESNEFALKLIDFAVTNNSSTDSIEEINNVLDIINDGLVNGQPVIDSSDPEITHMADYLSCFDISQPAILTLYADQPVAGKHNLFSGTNVGHSFISIKQGTKVKTLGFYPVNGLQSGMPNPVTLDPNDFVNVEGVFKNNEEHTYDVSLSIPINTTQLSNTINIIISIAESNPLYNLGSINCTDLAIIIFESQTNINIPSCESPYVIWDGQTPGTLGEIIRTLPLPTGATKNIIGGDAPINSNN